MNLASHSAARSHARLCWRVDLGLIAYGQACELQQRLVAARKSGAIPDVLVFCEHPPVITLGRNGKQQHLRAAPGALARMGIELCQADRGGDITFHGPGQIVGYPILDLADHQQDLRWYVWRLEEVMIRATGDCGPVAVRRDGLRGVWLSLPLAPHGARDSGRKREAVAGRGQSADVSPGDEAAKGSRGSWAKLGAVGVHVSRWVTSHGFAYNVSTDLRHFDLIVPCGISDGSVISLERALGRGVAIAAMRDRLAAHFAGVFACEVLPLSASELHSRLASLEEHPPTFANAPQPANTGA